MYDDTNTPSAIALMTEIFRSTADGAIKYSDEDVEAAIRTTWLPIFKYRSTLAMAINAVKTSLGDVAVSGLCDRYLACLEGTS
jgi:hypothetical protein